MWTDYALGIGICFLVVIGVPFVVYLCALSGTFGVFRALQKLKKETKEKRNGHES